MYTSIPKRYDTIKWQAYVTPSSDALTFSDGTKVRSLFELKLALQNLPEDVLQKDHSQLVSWLQDKINDPELAQSIKAVDHRWGMIVALERHLMRTLNFPPYVAKRWLQKTPLVFNFQSSETTDSLESLAKILPQISEDTISFHMERYPNDIARWVQDAIGDYELAQLLNEASNKDQMLRFIEDHLEMLHDAAE